MARVTTTGGRTSAAPLPELLGAGDVAAWLRTTKRAVYTMVERGQLPAPIHIGRRLLWDRAELVSWLESKRAVSVVETSR
jgi:excisionase family DNA binding protein